MATNKTPLDIFFCHRLCVAAVVLGHQNNLKGLDNLCSVMIAKISNENKQSKANIKV